MKKFIPYILMVAMIGTFFFVSFTGQSTVSAQQEEKKEGVLAWIVNEFGIGAWYAVGKDIYNNPLNLVPGVKIVDNYWGDWGKIADATIGQTLSWISSFTWFVSSKIFTLSGYLLDYAVDFSIKDFKKNIENIGVVTQGYKIILNLANMIFIFLILYIAIKTILGEGGDTKKLLTSIIIVALMINFSLFMTKVIIDASNIVAMGFYNAIQTEAGKVKIEGDEEEQKIISVGSVSTAMMAGLRLQTTIPGPDSKYNKESVARGLTHFNIALNQFGGSALFLVTAFVFFSVAILFIVRFITLLFYMMFSPVAFLGYISTDLKQYSSDWWKGFQSQAIFAPVFLFFAYLISSLVNSGHLWEAVGGNSNSSATFYDVISSPNPKGFAIVLNYVILVALMIGGLMTAKKMASVGSHGATKYAEKFQGWAQGMMGRNTIGRAAYLAGNNRYMAKLIEKSPTLGTFAKTQFDNVAGAKFGKGNKIGYAEALKKSIDKKKKMGEFVGKAKVGKTNELIRKEEDRLDRMKPVKELKDNVDKAQREVERLRNLEVDMRAFGAWTASDAATADLARETLQREEALMENRIDAELRVQDLASYKRKVQERMKKEYAKNIEFDSSILNKLFPSGADAAAEIRKGKSKGEKEIAELIEKLVAEKTKGQTGGTGATGGAGTGGTTGGGGGTTP